MWRWNTFWCLYTGALPLSFYLHNLTAFHSLWSQLHTEQISLSQLQELHSLHPAQPMLCGVTQSINPQLSQKGKLGLMWWIIWAKAASISKTAPDQLNTACKPHRAVIGSVRWRPFNWEWLHQNEGWGRREAKWQRLNWLCIKAHHMGIRFCLCCSSEKPSEQKNGVKLLQKLCCEGKHNKRSNLPCSMLDILTCQTR